MEHLSKSLLILSEKVKTLLIFYSNLLKENELLKNKVFLLEGDLAALKISLEEKRDLLDGQSEDTIFVSMLIDDLLESISHIHKNNNSFVFNKDLKDLHEEVLIEVASGVGTENAF